MMKRFLTMVMAGVICLGFGQGAIAAVKDEAVVMHTHNLILVEDDVDTFWVNNGLASGHVKYSDRIYYCIECGYSESRVEVAEVEAHTYSNGTCTVCGYTK
ncbi:MAG: hypothetical protein J6B85_08995 [Lachnospiraceae bacterium]|nr:hypothetical protein [Lachnospiraceae bacterium]